jgi:hypothetical protein
MERLNFPLPFKDKYTQKINIGPLLMGKIASQLKKIKRSGIS